MKRKKQSPEKIKKSKSINHISDTTFYKLTHNWSNGDIIRVINKSAKFIKQKDEDAMRKLEESNLESRQRIDALNSCRSGKNSKLASEKRRKKKERVQKNGEDKSNQSPIRIEEAEKNIDGDDDDFEELTHSSKSKIYFEQESYVAEEEPKETRANKEDHYSSTTAESLQMDHIGEDSGSEELVFHVVTKTGAEHGAEPMSGDVFIKLIDENGLNSDYIDLNSSNEMEPPYMKLSQSGRDHRFIITVDKSLTKIEYVLVGLKCSSNSGSWFLECVEIEGPIRSGDTSSADNYIFPCRRCIGSKSADRKTEITLQRISPLQSRERELEVKLEGRQSNDLDSIDNKSNNMESDDMKDSSKPIPPLQCGTLELNSDISESKELADSIDSSGATGHRDEAESTGRPVVALGSSEKGIISKNSESTKLNISARNSTIVEHNKTKISHTSGLPLTGPTTQQLNSESRDRSQSDSGDSKSRNVANNETEITYKSAQPSLTSQQDVTFKKFKSKEKNNSINKAAMRPPISLFGPTIHDAVMTHDYDRVKELYELYPNIINSEDPKGRKPIHLAVIYLSKSTPNSLKIFEYLVDNKVNLNVISGEGFGLLHYCVLENNMLAAQKLVEQAEDNFDFRLTDRSDNSPLILALKLKKLEMANFLMQCYDKFLEPAEDESPIIDLLKEFDDAQLKPYSHLHKLHATTSPHVMSPASAGTLEGDETSGTSRSSRDPSDGVDSQVGGSVDSSQTSNDNLQGVGKLNVKEDNNLRPVNANDDNDAISNMTASKKNSSIITSPPVVVHDERPIVKSQLDNVPSKIDDQVTSGSDELSYSKENNSNSYIGNKPNEISPFSSNGTISFDRNEDKLHTNQPIAGSVTEEESKGNIRSNDDGKKQGVNLDDQEDVISKSSTASSSSSSSSASNGKPVEREDTDASRKSPEAPLQSAQLNDSDDKVAAKAVPEPALRGPDNTGASRIAQDTSAAINDEDDIYKTLPNEKVIPVPDDEESDTSIGSSTSTLSGTTTYTTTEVNSVTSDSEQPPKESKTTANSKKTHNVHFSEPVADRAGTDKSMSMQNEHRDVNDAMSDSDRKSSTDELVEVAGPNPKKLKNRDNPL